MASAVPILLLQDPALAAVMTVPRRNASPEGITESRRIFFVTAKTHGSRPLFQIERNASLFIEVLRSCVARGAFKVHDFVVMPDHVHILISMDASCSVERAMQLCKGGFSFQIKRRHGYLGEVWQRGFSEVRVYDEESLQRHRHYIALNPVRAGLAAAPGLFPYCFVALARSKQGLKPSRGA